MASGNYVLVHEGHSCMAQFNHNARQLPTPVMTSRASSYLLGCVQVMWHAAVACSRRLRALCALPPEDLDARVQRIARARQQAEAAAGAAAPAAAKQRPLPRPAKPGAGAQQPRTPPHVRVVLKRRLSEPAGARSAPRAGCAPAAGAGRGGAVNGAPAGAKPGNRLRRFSQRMAEAQQDAGEGANEEGLADDESPDGGEPAVSL